MVSVYDLVAAPAVRPRQQHAAAVITAGTLSLVAGALPLAASEFAHDRVDPVTAAARADRAAAAASPGLVPVGFPAPVASSQQLDDLVRAVDLAARTAAEEAERARAAAERAALEQEGRELAAAADCDTATGGLGAVQPWVRAAARALACRHGEPRLLGVGSRGRRSDHPSGHAVDFMVDRATGDALAECALRHRAELGITYVLWRQRINHGGGWEAMADRGGATANHHDHVHISFARSSPGSPPALTC